MSVVADERHMVFLALGRENHGDDIRFASDR